MGLEAHSRPRCSAVGPPYFAVSLAVRDKLERGTPRFPREWGLVRAIEDEIAAALGKLRAAGQRPFAAN
jgi:hypothetical protein